MSGSRERALKATGKQNKLGLMEQSFKKWVVSNILGIKNISC